MATTFNTTVPAAPTGLSSTSPDEIAAAVDAVSAIAAAVAFSAFSACALIAAITKSRDQRNRTMKTLRRRRWKCLYGLVPQWIQLGGGAALMSPGVCNGGLLGPTGGQAPVAVLGRAGRRPHAQTHPPRLRGWAKKTRSKAGFSEASTIYFCAMIQVTSVLASSGETCELAGIGTGPQTPLPPLMTLADSFSTASF